MRPAAASGGSPATTSSEACELAFAALWDIALQEATRQDLSAPILIARVAREAGLEALACVQASVTREREALVGHSADLIGMLILLWATAGVEPDEIWTELHKRERIGTLLHDMAYKPGRPKRRLTRPWRVDSTKLP
ncbi:hypothetical protein [Lichenicoccus sp.]|uniref:hypothetical protein n=1 Tax=Lichenicoccus sp. TaxID=2781899 RepID=UPI003D0B202C